MRIEPAAYIKEVMRVRQPVSVYERNPFVGPNELTLADVARCLKDDLQIPPALRNEIATSIDALAAALEVAPSMVPARGPDIKHAHNRLCRMPDAESENAAMRHHRNALVACRLLGIDLSNRAFANYLSADWLDLWRQLSERHDQIVLTRLIQFCSANEIKPTQVNDETVRTVRAACLVGAFGQESCTLAKRIENVWNRQVDANSSWPRQRLTPPERGWRGTALPFDAFPEQYRESVAAYLYWISDRDPLLENPPPRICGPATVRHQRTMLRLAASALVNSGWAAADIKTLSHLVEPASFRAILRFYLARNGGEPSVFVRGLSRLLYNIARHWVRADRAQLDLLWRLVERLGRDDRGLSIRNRAVLRAFDDPAERQKLLSLPQCIVVSAKRRRLCSHRRAVRVQVALALELLLMAPMRIGQLIQLQIDKHLRLAEQGQDLAKIVVPDSERILGDPLEYELPRESVRLLRTYLHEHRPHLAIQGGQWLFPSTSGARKGATHLSCQIRQAARDHVGIDLAPKHLRHFAAKLVLEADPYSLETVRRLLGHSTVSLTKSLYEDLAAPASALMHDEIVAAGLRSTTGAQSRPRRNCQ